jgi:hypothetical protein
MVPARSRDEAAATPGEATGDFDELLAGKACLDVVTTATIRPELLDLCYRSFTSRLLGAFPRRRLILNVDPYGDPRPAADVADVARRYFGEVVLNTPESGSFPQAVRWGWQQVSSPIFFHLEDDWLLRRQVDLRLVRGAFADPGVGQLAFQLGQPSARRSTLTLRPSFVRTALMRQLLPLFDIHKDPEKQWSAAALEGWELRDYPARRMLTDTGKKWRKGLGIRKSSADDESTWSFQAAPQGLQSAYYRVKYRAFLAAWRLSCSW